MKSIILTAALLSTQLVAVAQEVTSVQIGPNNDQSTKILKPLGENRYGVFYMAGKNDDLYIQRYNSGSLAIDFNTKVDIPAIAGVKLEVEEMFLFNENIILFATGYNASESAFVTYSFTIDEMGHITNKGELVYKNDVEKKSRSGEVKYRMSPDRTHILIYNRSYLKKEEATKFSFILIDAKGEVVTDQNFKVANAERNEVVRILNFSLDANNDIHTCISTKKYNKQTKESTESFEVVSYKKANEYEPLKTELNLKDNNIIASLSIAVKKDNTIAVGGFYIPLIKGNRATGIEGTFYTTIDADGTAAPFVMSPISTEFKKRVISDKRAEKGVDLPLTYVVREAFVDENDNFMFLAEDYRYSQGQNGQGDNYYYGYILALKLDTEGKIMWEQLVNKRQNFQEIKIGGFMGGASGAFTYGVGAFVQVNSDKNSYLSFKATYTDGKIVIIYNDDKKNISIPDDSEKRNMLTNALKGVPFSASIDETGKLTYALEAELGDEETAMRPRLSLIDNGKIFFITAKRDVEKVGVGSFK